MNHTPGPWNIGGPDVDSTTWWVNGPDKLLSVAEACGDDLIEAEANARLIAVAPEMVEILQDLIAADAAALDTDEFDRLLRPILEKAKVVIAKAKGESE